MAESEVGEVVYVTKYFLTSGVISVGRVVDEGESYVWVEYPEGLNRKMMLRLNTEAFTTLEKAQRRCATIASAKINAILKQKEKLDELWRSALDGEVPVVPMSPIESILTKSSDGGT